MHAFAQQEHPMAKHRVGIIGRTGKGNYGHGLDVSWQHIDSVEVAALSDEHAGGRAAGIKRSGAKTAYADYREMLDKEKLDIVVIAPRWIDKHHEFAMACAEHSCHMYMEKPFCPNLEQADAVVHACEMRHLKFAIAHITRYSPQTRVVKQLIRSGAIGDVLEVRVRGKEDSRRGGGEDLWVLGTHMLDLSRYLFGEVESGFASVYENGQPVNKSHVKPGNEGIGPLAGDHIQATLRFKTGVTGFFASKRGAAGSPSRFGLTIHGSKGIIEMQSGYLRTAYILKDPSWSPGRTGSKWEPISSNGVGKPETIKVDSHAGGNMDAAKDLINAIEKDGQPISSVYDALAATEMIVSMFESHRLAKPVAFPLKNRKNPLTML
jgi:predicted dehydrogenase